MRKEIFEEEDRHHRKVYSRHDKLELVNDPNVVDGGNFPIKRNGKIYWVSRSNVVSIYVFCKNRMGEWCVVASKRGTGGNNRSLVGLWNVPCGYLDYGYTLEETAIKECWEEVGVDISNCNIYYYGTNSSHKHGDVNTIYYAVLDGTIDMYKTSIANAEPNECEKAEWISLTNVPKLNWVGNMKWRIIDMITNLSKNEKNTNDNIDMNEIDSTLKKLLSNRVISQEKYNKILSIINAQDATI